MNDHIIPFHKPPLSKKDLENVLDSLISEDLLSGKVCHLMENTLAQFLGRKYALTLNSLTAAFHCIWLTISLAEDEEVIIPSYYTSQVLSSIHFVKAKAVITDYDKEGFFYDLEKLAQKINEKTRVIVIPYLYGDTRNHSILENIKKNHPSIILIEDISHCLGASINEKSLGTFSTFAVISLTDDSIITTGNGACILLDHQKNYYKIKDLRNNQITENFFQKAANEDEVSFYSRFDYQMADFQAALAIAQIKNLKKFNVRRNEIAELYRKAFIRTNHKFLHNDDQPVSFRFPLIVASDIDPALIRLRKEKIKVRNKAYLPIHRIQGLGNEEFFHANRLYQKVLEIPLFPQMRKRDVDRVIKAISKIP